MVLFIDSVQYSKGTILIDETPDQNPKHIGI